jgi:hypothetical protein
VCWREKPAKNRFERVFRYQLELSFDGVKRLSVGAHAMWLVVETFTSDAGFNMEELVYTNQGVGTAYVECVRVQVSVIDRCEIHVYCVFYRYVGFTASTGDAFAPPPPPPSLSSFVVYNGCMNAIFKTFPLPSRPCTSVTVPTSCTVGVSRR